MPFENVSGNLLFVLASAAAAALAIRFARKYRAYRREREVQRAAGRRMVEVLNAVRDRLGPDFPEDSPVSVMDWDPRHIDAVHRAVTRELIVRAAHADEAFREQEEIRARGRKLLAEKQRVPYSEAKTLVVQAALADQEAERRKKHFWRLQNAATEVGFTMFGEIKIYLLIDPATV